MSSLLTACSVGDITQVKQILAGDPTAGPDHHHHPEPLAVAQVKTGPSSSSSSPHPYGHHPYHHHHLRGASGDAGRTKGISVTDSERRTCLHHACMNGHLRLVRYLVENGAKMLMEKNDRSRETPLFLACRGGYPRLCYFLIEEAQANIHGRNIDGRSLLHVCVESGDLETAALLVKKGLELNGRDKYGETPLHTAVAQRNLPFVQFLLKQGASPSLASATGRTPLMMAKEIEDDDDFIRAFEEELTLPSQAQANTAPSGAEKKRKAEPGEEPQGQSKRPKKGNAPAAEALPAPDKADEKATKPSTQKKAAPKSRSKGAGPAAKPVSEAEPLPKRRGQKSRPAPETEIAGTESLTEKVEKNRKPKKAKQNEVQSEVEKVKRRADKGKQKEESESPLASIEHLLEPLPKRPAFRPPFPRAYQPEPEPVRHHFFELSHERRGDRLFGGSGVIHRIKQDLEKEGFCANAFEDDYSGGFGARVMDVVSHIVI